MPLENASIVIPGDTEATLRFCVEHFITAYSSAVSKNGIFCVALAGGSTPKKIYELLCSPDYNNQINWNKIQIFWSDERSVAPTDPNNNYTMAMNAGFAKMPIPLEHIHRMVAESNIEHHAKEYEQTIRSILHNNSFDLTMLGVGEDGHIASLFPNTKGLHTTGHLVVANYIEEKKTWRMTLTLECINDSSQIVVYMMGKTKSTIFSKILSSTNVFPCQFVGTPNNPALWIIDQNVMKKQGTIQDL
jgi:6-phosphogluconolactonase